MRELRVRIRFTKACLGSQKQAVAGQWPMFLLPRGVDHYVRFDPAWWQSGLQFAANLLSRHQDAVRRICVDGRVYTGPDAVTFYRRSLPNKRYIKHECFAEGVSVELHCAVPDEINNAALSALFEKLGAFRGISPFGPREYGFFTVTGVEPWEQPHVEEVAPSPEAERVGREIAPRRQPATGLPD